MNSHVADGSATVHHHWHGTASAQHNDSDGGGFSVKSQSTKWQLVIALLGVIAAVSPGIIAIVQTNSLGGDVGVLQSEIGELKNELALAQKSLGETSTEAETLRITVADLNILVDDLNRLVANQYETIRSLNLNNLSKSIGELETKAQDIATSVQGVGNISERLNLLDQYFGNTSERLNLLERPTFDTEWQALSGATQTFLFPDGQSANNGNGVIDVKWATVLLSNDGGATAWSVAAQTSSGSGSYGTHLNIESGLVRLTSNYASGYAFNTLTGASATHVRVMLWL